MIPVDLFLEPLFLSLVSGIVVGFSIGLIGSGGSVLAVPLLLYVVGVKDTHVAIGTSALAVGIIAAIHIISHRKNKTLEIKKGLLFAFPGVPGTLVGSQLGLWTPSENLIVLFAVFMVGIGVLMLKNDIGRIKTVGESRFSIIKNNLMLSGFSIGILAGYFGIGGGFLIVPTMMYSGGLNILQAIGTSLVSVSSFGLVTAGRYFVAGNVDFMIAMIVVVGGIFGGYAGMKTSEKTSKEMLTKIFSLLLFAVAFFVLASSVM